MLISRRKFFKRKNREKIYNIYYAYDLSETYERVLNNLRKTKDEYRCNYHIWKILSDVEYDTTTAFQSCSFLRCNNLKRAAFLVSLQEYDSIILDTQKLARAIGNIEKTLSFVDYLENNNLVVRAK